VNLHHVLRRSKAPLAVSLKENPLKSQSLECRPRHGLLPQVEVLWFSWRLGRCAFTEAWIGCEPSRVCCGCVAESCWGGRSITRDLLRDRSRNRSVITPRNARGVGELDVDVGDSGSLESTDFCESNVDVRMGGVGLKLS
jgi:hypothetical protein